MNQRIIDIPIFGFPYGPITSLLLEERYLLVNLYYPPRRDSVENRPYSPESPRDMNIVDRIIGHLKLTFVAERRPPPQAVFQEFLLDADPPVEY